jgi:hypothetical protein
MFDNKWLEDLKVGDKVIEDLHFDGKSISTVVRFTKTMIIVKSPRGYENRYKRDGFAPNAGSREWSSHMIREATPEALAKFEEERYRTVFQNKLSYLSWADVPLDRIKEIREIIEPYIRKQEKTNEPTI